MDISLTPDLERFVRQKVRTKQYPNANEVVRAALRNLKDQETWTAKDIAELRKEIAIGIEEMDRGEVVEYTAEDIKREGRRILAKMKKKTA